MDIPTPFFGMRTRNEAAPGRSSSATGQGSTERIGDRPNPFARPIAFSIAEILTIGFARRFATYKRGAAPIHDKDRLHKLLNDSTRPFNSFCRQSANPRDEGGKALIQSLQILA